MRSVNEFDKWSTALVQNFPESYRRLMALASFLGEPLLVITIGFLSFLLASVNQQIAMQRAFFYAAAAFTFSSLLKLALHRARPHNLEIRTFGLKSYSFPSGHAFGTVIFYGLLSYIDLAYLAHPWDLISATVLWLLIIAVGISRVYLKVHYPSDVLAGWLLGLVSLSVVIGLAF